MFSISVKSQSKILPGDKSLNMSLIKTGKFTMGYNVVQDGKATEICIYETELNLSNQKFNLKTSLNFISSDLQWKEDIVADIKTLKPIRRISERDTRSFTINFSDNVTGELTTKGKPKGKPIKFSITEEYFDIATYPYVLAALPLTTGYKATIPVLDYDAKEPTRVYHVLVNEVKSHIFRSDLTGDHNVWKVAVFEESSKNIFNYYIDKETRKIWRVDISANRTVLFLLDKETDFNPFKNKFDKEETLRMIKQGSSTILGETFARDDRSGKDDKLIRIDILNVNKKQFVPKGTKVLLMPYTAFYKEWFDINKKQAKVKNAKPIPLPNDARECIVFTEVYNDDGNFEFTNLMPGEYLLFTSFNYQDFFSKSEVVGKANVYANGHYQGTEVYTDMFGYTQQGNANYQKNVSIKKNGETLKVKLKR